jgi:hypothetical protein
MSQIGPGTMGLPLFEPTPPPVQAKLRSLEELHAEWMNTLRALVLMKHGGREVTMDDVHDCMDAAGSKLPAGASPNILGGFFSGWAHARPACLSDGTPKWTRSKRAGANGNLLRVWKVE